MLEILVALVVLGMLMVVLTQGVRFGLTAWTTQDRLIARQGDLDSVDRALRRMITDIAPGSAVDPLVVAGTDARLAFTAPLPIAGGDGEAEQDVDMLLLQERGRLLLRWSPHRHVRRVGAPPAPHEEVLLEGVTALRIAYWQPDRGWLSDWDDRRAPALIRLRIQFAAGDPRHWPDIVAAPLRVVPPR